MRKPSPLKHKEVADETLHNTLSRKEHSEVHADDNVHEAEIKNDQEELEQKQKNARTTGTDIDVLQDDYNSNVTISQEDLHKGDFWDDAEDRMVINLRNSDFVKNLNITVTGPDDDDSLDAVGRHDFVQLENEFGMKLRVKKNDPKYMDKINLFAKKTRAERLRLATQEKEKTGDIVEKTTPVIRNGKPVTWKQVTKDVNMYNTLTEGEKSRLADQEEIKKFESSLLNIQRTNNRLKDEEDSNSIIKPPLPEELQEKDDSPLITNIKVEDQDPDNLHVNTSATDGKSHKNRKKYIKKEKIKNESLVLKQLSAEEGREPGEFFQTKQEWLDYKQQQAIEDGPAGLVAFDLKKLEAQWDEMIAKREENNPELLRAKEQNWKDNKVVDEILSAEDNDDWRSKFFKFGEDENLDFGELDDDVRSAIMDVILPQEYQAAQKKGIRGTDIGEGILDFITGLNLREKERIIKLAKEHVLADKADQFVKDDEEYKRQEQDYIELVTNYNTEAEELQKLIEQNTLDLKEGGYIDKVNHLNERGAELEQSWKNLEEDFAKLGDVDENSSPEDIAAYNELVSRWKKLKVQTDAHENNSLNKDETYQALLKKGQELENRRLELEGKGSIIEGQRKNLEDFLLSHNKYKESVFAELGYNVADNSFDNAFERTESFDNFKNHIVDNYGVLGKVMDVGLTFADAMLKMNVFNRALSNPYVLAIVGGASLGGAAVDKKLGYDAYTLDDVIWDGLANFSKAEIFPTAEGKEGDITTGVESKKETAIGRFFDPVTWNINGYSLGKTVAEMLPYSLIIAKEGRKALMKPNARKKIVEAGSDVVKGKVPKGLNAKTILNSINKKYLMSDKGKQAMAMVKATYRTQYVEEVSNAKALGLNVFQQHAYANGMTLATGLSQMVMPDSNYFGGGTGKKLLNEYVKNLSRAANKKAASKVTSTFFKNIAKELGEEELELGLRDLVSYSMLASHSPEILDLEVQRQTIMGTIALSGGMGTIGAKRDYDAIRNRIYEEFQEKGYDAIKSIDSDIEALETKIKEVDKSNDPVKQDVKTTLTEALEELQKAKEHAIDIVTAINVSPDVVSSDQIDNIVKKNKLIKEKEGKDPATVANINKEIKDLNEKIENSTVQQNQEFIYEKLLKNSMKISENLGIKFNESRQEGYKAAVVEENARRRKQNKKRGVKKGDKGYEAPVNNDTPGFRTFDADGNQVIFVNKDAAMSNKNFAVTQHELLHGVLKETLAKNPKAVTGLAQALRGHLTKDKMFTNYINVKMKSYEGLSQIEKDEELLAVTSEAITQGHLKYDSGLMSKIGDALRGIAREFGWNMEIKDGRDVFNFLRDYNKEVARGRLSKGMKNIAIKGITNINQDLLTEEEKIVHQGEDTRPGAEEKKVMESKPIYQRVDQMYQDNKGDWKNPNKKKRLAQQMAYEFEGNVIDRLKDLKGFNFEDKQDIALDFITSEERGLAGVIEGFDPERMIDKETGKPYESVSAYVNHKLPNGMSLIDARLMEFYQKDPKYSNIIKSLSEEETQRKFEKEQKQGISGTRQEQEAIRFKIADRLGPEAKALAETIKSKLTDKEGNLLEKYKGKNIKELRGIALAETQELFGIKPKPGNLTKTDIKNAQFFISKNAPALWLMLPEGYTQGGTSTGVTSVLMTERPTKKNKLEEIQDVFYTKSIIAKGAVNPETGELVVEEKAKRPVNLEVQKKREDISIPDFKAVFGITQRGDQNLYRKEDNTSSRIRALVSETERMIVNQVARELDPTQYALADGISRVMYSNAFNNADIEIQEAILRGLDNVNEKLNKIDVTKDDEVDRVLNEAFFGLPKKLITELKKDIGLGLRGAKLGALRQYRKTLNAYEGSEEFYYVTLAEKISKDFKKGLEDAQKNLAKLSGVKSWNGKPATKANLFQSNEQSANLINTARQDITAQIADMKAKVDAGKMSVEQMLTRINLMWGMYAQASKASDGRFDLTEPGGKVVYNPNNEIGGQRGQVVFNQKDWVALVNNASDKNNPILPTKENGLIDKAALIEMYGFDPTLLKDKSAAVLGEIEINKDGNMFLPTQVARDAQANEARSLIKQQLQHWKNRINDGSDAFNEVDMLMQFYSMMSGMETPLRKGAMIYGVGDGVTNVSKSKIGSELEFDHAKPAHEVMTRIAAVVANSPQSKWNKEIDKIFKDYIVNIIPKKMDIAVKEQGRQSVVQEGYFDGDASFAQIMARLFSADTKFHPDMVPITSIRSESLGQRWGQEFVAVRENILAAPEPMIMESKKISEAIRLNRKANINPRGMSAFDFDETVGISDNYVIATRDGKTKRIASDKWPFVGDKMIQEGWKMDFSDFNRVTGGRPGPLMEKMKNQIKKFGPSNVFILTARAPESEQAIHEYLKSEGINIPLKNITGLGNSTGEAKALWMLEKFAEGYNDMYFVDDALPNVKAVKNVLEQLDIKSKVRQARVMESANIDNRFNTILEDVSGVEREKEFSKTKAAIRGKGKGRWKFFIPPSAEDFNGLLYALLPKGKKGEQAYDFFRKNLLDPFARGIRELTAAKQRIGDDYKALRKAMPDVRRKLTKKIPGLKDYHYADAVRVYLWDKAGYDIPGLSETDKNKLINIVKKDERLQAFADALGLISKRPEGYVKPREDWLVTNILGDLSDAVDKIGRKEFLAEWKENKDIIFSEKNLNKLEAIYGSNYVEALRDMLYRMENGTNRVRGSGNRLVNSFMNWTNNSVGAIMFFNARSAVLQTLSSVNFINWGDNNVLAAAKAFANQKQFWKDFAMLFNSDMLKQRRKGLKTDVNHAELTEAVGRSKNPAMAALNYLLQKGFLPTQLADSFAIASGGATFIRNRINTYLKDGLSKKEAETKAFEDFQEIAEATQQSSRPDFISQQQASPLGRLILAFANTPMQYARLTKRAIQDLAAGRGDAKTHISKIIYYGAVQNLIFGALQSALFALAFDDDEDDKEKDADAEKKKMRVLNGMLDSILRGIGVGGAVVSTIKNMLIKLGEENKKDWNKDYDNVVIEGLQVSPPIGSKVRKLISAGDTYDYNEEVIPRMKTFDVDNPIWEVIGNVVSAVTNVPLDRLVKKTKNIKDSLDDQNETWQRIALMLGWNRWDLRMDKPEEVERIKEEIKKEKAEARKEKYRIEKEQREKEKEKQKIEEGKKKQAKEKEEGKELTCLKCKNPVVAGKKYCTVHEKAEQRADGKKSQCKKIKSNGKRCGMQTSSKSGYCYYHD